MQRSTDPGCLEPAWSIPGVTAFTTTRRGGHSAPPWESFNLGTHVGDTPENVAANRALLQQRLPGGARIQWLQQVHGSAVVRATGEGVPEADACWSGTAGIACTVMTADCLPVLFAQRDGLAVAAAHAGWRGLLSGVLENTIAAMATPPGQLCAWMGPAIGPLAFEVGEEVRQAFLARGGDATAFTPGAESGRYMADLYALARQRLLACGVTQIAGGEYCTYRQSELFFSYRRDGQTGRMASLILINP